MVGTSREVPGPYVSMTAEFNPSQIFASSSGSRSPGMVGGVEEVYKDSGVYVLRILRS